MKMFKRTITSMIRKPYQMILMFLIVFVLGNVLFASIAVKQSSDNVKAELRQRIPSKIMIDINRERALPYGRLNLMNEFLENIEKHEDVQKVTYLRTYEYFQTYEFDDEIWHGRNGCYGFGSLDDPLLDLKIIEGRNYTQEDLDGDIPKIVVAEGEGEVGDIYRVSLVDYEVIEEESWGDTTRKTIAEKSPVTDFFDFEIIGIMDIGDYNEKVGTGYSYIPIYNKWIDGMYQSYLDMLDAHSREDQYVLSQFGDSYLWIYNSAPYYENIVITVKGMDALEKLETEVRDIPGFVREAYIVKSSAEDYRYIQAPLENLTALANVAMVSSAILVIVLLSLVSILFMRNRKHEIGILMALGERKMKVLGQFVCEILLVGLLAASCSMITGNKLGEVISNQFMKIQIDVDGELAYQKENEGAMTQLDLVEAYEVEINAEYIASIYAITIVILLISSSVPVLYILRMKPKEVLM